MFSQNLCQVCSKNPKKYTCPRCSRYTCSLACSLSHKRAFSCSGKIDRLSHLKLTPDGEEGEIESKCISPDDLLKDARFLEHVANSVEMTGNHTPTAQEDRKKASRLVKTRRQRDLIKVIRQVYSNTRLLFLPTTFSRAQQNKSHAQVKTKRVYWTVEVEHDGIARLLHSVPDAMKVGELCGCSSHHTVFVYDEAVGVRKPGWIPLPNFVDASIREALKDVGIVEFPRFRFCKVEAVGLDEQ